MLFVIFFNISALEQNQAEVRFTNLGQPITIIEPQNITYNFNIGENYSIFINASSSFNLSFWRYTLFDVTHGVEKAGTFSIGNNNASAVSGFMDAYRWSNKFTIFGKDVNNQEYNKSVFFFVNISNSAPIIENYSEQIFVCENTSLKAYFTSYDVDENAMSVSIYPLSPFYITPFVSIGYTRLVAEIYSGILGKSRVGNYQRTISVSDGQYSDSKSINITVIGINNPPVIQNLGVQTVWLVGANSMFNKTLQVTDLEDGNQDLGNLNLTINFSGRRLFEINSSGEMYYIPIESDIGVHNITVCAEDNGLSSVHQNISLCNKTGEKIKTCNNFSLTVTNENRAPTITSYFPSNLFLSVNGEESILFNITKYDPDFTIPDSYWYVDGVLTNYYSGSSNDTFNYLFGCGVFGNHTIKVEITDGALNDSLTWNVGVSLISCSVPESSGGGGGGGGGGASCEAKFACDEWAVCQNAEESLTNGIISGEDYRVIKEKCNNLGYNDNNCGFQLRYCTDLNNCTRVLPSGSSLNECFFTVNPSCNDGIKNCHDTGCELLVDCGGPCSICPTCSDGLLNQNEQDVDCGGPCPFSCKKVESSNLWTVFLSFLNSSPGIQIVLAGLILVVVILIIYLIRRISLIKQEKKRLIYRYFKNKDE